MKSNKILIALLLLSVFSVSLVQAQTVPQVPQFDTGFMKWTMCDMFNLTKWSCDAWWESDSNPYYIKPTTETNLTDYYNKTEIAQLFANYYNKTEILTLATSSGLNLTSEVNLTEPFNMTEIDEKLSEMKKALMVNFSDKFVEKDDKYYGVEGSDDNNIIYGIIILAVGGIIGLLIYMNKRKQKEDRKNRRTGTDSEMEDLLRLKKLQLAGQLPQATPQPPQVQPLPQQVPQAPQGINKPIVNGGENVPTTTSS